MIGRRRDAFALVNRLDRSWALVQGMGAAPRTEERRAEAVPDVDGRLDLTAALGPNRVLWRLTRTNDFDDEVVGIEFLVTWTYGATYRGGGAFVTDARVAVASCLIRPGFRADIAVTVAPPLNRGSSGAPIAGLPFVVHGGITTRVGTEPIIWRCLVQGDGAVA